MVTIAMVFPGQGSQSQGMLAELAAQHPGNTIAEGEYWRLLSGHFAHLGYPHLALNLAGLLLVWLLVGRLYAHRE